LCKPLFFKLKMAEAHELLIGSRLF
jgi:hypothetical protein